MNIRRVLLPTLLLLPSLCPAASREIVELQRDVALLQEQVRTMQRSLDERLGALTTLVQQNIDSSNKANTSVAVLESFMRDRLRDQEKLVTGPVAGLGAKVDQMSTDFQAVRESVTDLTARMGKLQQQITDLSNAVRTMQAPAPPPGSSPGVPGAGSGPAASQIPAETLYQNALRDRSGGKYDLALQQFAEYLKSYGNTDLAPNAQYYTGDIHYTQGDYETALKDFDTVLERYPENNRSPDARYMKGQALLKLGRRTAAAKEFQELIRLYPNSNLATKARAQLHDLGLSAGGGGSAARRRRR
jgi:tol-pal system protein YbgF